MIEKLQVYTSNSLDPYTNLAVEKHLFDKVHSNCCILYLWQNKNTVVIGRNQNPWAECKCSLFESEGGKIARRLSGGGAVFHDVGNLNFTFITSAENMSIQKNLQVIQTACRIAGIDTEVSGRNDMLAGGKKFSGNAFFNSAGRSYHHGTILVNADTKKMTRYLTPSIKKLESKGVKSVRSRVINLSEICPSLTCQQMKQYMISAFEDIFQLPSKEFKAIDRNEVLSLAQAYGSRDYIYASSIPFTTEFEEHFHWGHIQLRLDVKDDIIKSVQLYTDSMDWHLSELIEKALLHCRFELISINDILSQALPHNIYIDILKMLKNSGI